MIDFDYSQLAIAKSAFPAAPGSYSSLVGTRVVSPQDVDLGTVVEAVMDAFNSRVAFLVLAYGGFLGMGEKRFAVPWNALRYDDGQQVFVLNLAQDAIGQLPVYDEDNWPDFTGDRWTVHGRGGLRGQACLGGRQAGQTGEAREG